MSLTRLVFMCSSLSFRAYVCSILFFFFFNDTATTEIYTLSLHDALPICGGASRRHTERTPISRPAWAWRLCVASREPRSEEHTSELQSQSNLVCRLLLEKKKKKTEKIYTMKNNIVINCSYSASVVCIGYQ